MLLLIKLPVDSSKYKFIYKIKVKNRTHTYEEKYLLSQCCLEFYFVVWDSIAIQHPIKKSLTNLKL